MARQDSLLKIKGELDGISFYKSNGQYFARKKGGIEAARLASDPAFARTRENISEFGLTAKATKLLRDTLRPLMLNASGKKLHGRLTSILSEVKKFDSNSVRGQRTVGNGMNNLNAKALLKGFNLCGDSSLNSLLFAPYALNPATGDIAFTGLGTQQQIKCPADATHVELTGAWAQIDFANNTGELQVSAPANLPISAVNSSNFTLTPANVPTTGGVDFFLLKISFYQQINNAQYPLSNSSSTALCIIAVM